MLGSPTGWITDECAFFLLFARPERGDPAPDPVVVPGRGFEEERKTLKVNHTELPRHFTDKASTRGSERGGRGGSFSRSVLNHLTSVRDPRTERRTKSQPLCYT
ncbi:unnamed protein product [Prunus armeniaca]|uniref:Uncharacterized protein n=1 Tax=Prunus armeniaca TaxID=36596 RepID=A0A6J5XWA8_PRUAR|nr:unnamed protein product [Prunus armeniaca]CAB4316577.1 unnamed protein product [Prunus armeniaca]